jgi:hypothetical protein
MNEHRALGAMVAPMTRGSATPASRDFKIVLILLQILVKVRHLPGVNHIRKGLRPDQLNSVCRLAGG